MPGAKPWLLLSPGCGCVEDVSPSNTGCRHRPRHRSTIPLLFASERLEQGAPCGAPCAVRRRRAPRSLWRGDTANAPRAEKGNPDAPFQRAVR